MTLAAAYVFDGTQLFISGFSHIISLLLPIGHLPFVGGHLATICILLLFLFSAFSIEWYIEFIGEWQKCISQDRINVS